MLPNCLSIHVSLEQEVTHSGYSAQVKDNMRLSGVVKSTATLLSKLGMGELTAGWIIEEFTAQMRAVSKIALHRRSNLANFLESNGIVSFFTWLYFPGLLHRIHAIIPFLDYLLTVLSQGHFRIRRIFCCVWR